MMVVVFQVRISKGRAPDCFNLAGALRLEFDRIDGFISVERGRPRPGRDSSSC
jgi:heme-degrading monooxygenase HmoA